MKYPGFEVILADQLKTVRDLVQAISGASEVCVFWADDDKPIVGDFLERMVAPLNDGTGLHLWSGNAMAVRYAVVRTRGSGEFVFNGRSFLKVMLPFLESVRVPGTRSQLALSSIERLAPLCTDPVGIPS